MTLRAVLVAAALAGAVAPEQPSPAQAPRTLAPTIPIHGSLAGGERASFTFDVPAATAAQVFVQQEGVDLRLVLRPRGTETPTHSVDFVGGTAGVERLYPAVGETAASWEVMISPVLASAARGNYTITLEQSPADDRARAVASARALHYRTLTPNAVEDAPAILRQRAGYAEVAAAALAAGDIEQAAEGAYQEARRADTLGDTPAALEGQRRALALFRQAGRRDREARVLNRLGDLSRKVGEVADAEQYFNEALPLARAAGDQEAISDILNNSGLLLVALGRYDDAIERLQTAVPLAQAINSANVEGALLLNLGEAYYDLGDYDRAVDYYQRAVEVMRQMRLPRRVGRAQESLAQAYFARGERAKAEETIASAIALFEQSGDRVYLASGLTTHGLMRQATGDNDGAIALFARAQPILHESRIGRGEARVLNGWAEADLARGDLAGALARADEALRYARDAASPGNEARALYMRARTLRAMDRLPDAAIAIDGAIRVVENTRGALQGSELKTSYLAAVRGYYDLSVDILQRQGRTADAFAASERSRARTLLEGLAQSAAKIEKGVDPALVSRRRALQARIAAKENYRAQLSLQGDKTALASAEAKAIAGLREQLAGVERAIQSASPSYWALQQPEPVDLARVQTRLLDTRTTLVEYHIGDDRSYAWVVDRASIAAVPLPGAAELEDLARQYHQSLSREIDALPAPERARVTAQSAALGRRLAAAIWTPVAAKVKGARLLVVADGALQYVPFAALPSPAGTPLVASYEIVYLPSASVLETLRRDARQASAARASAAVFADPVFSKNDPRFAAAQDGAAPARTRASDGGEYTRLRFSRREAEAIAAVSPGALQALDFSASKSALLGRTLRDYQILHFATHGVLNTQRPELSGLVFSLVDRNGKPVDGFLRLHEIYNLDLDADLVVLSACRTALGKEVHGEGLIGLTRGFMYAGASRVVSSVWNVDDRASAELMKRFYEAMLVRKLAPAAALREAQLALVGNPRWSNPHYWAAFGAYGDPK